MKLFSLLLGIALLASGESAAGLKWFAPAGWKAEAGSRPMRAATYTVGDAECVAYFFGADQGGSVEANIERWKGQFHNGSPAKVGKRTVHGLAVTTIDVSGDYAGMGGGVQPATRLLAAIVEGPAGNVFFKFTGPVKTVTANQAKFEALILSVRK